MRMTSKSEPGCHCSPRFPVLQQVLSVVQSTRPQEDTQSLTMQSAGTDFNPRLPFLLQVHVTAMSGILKGTFEEADSASLCSSVQESDDDVF